MNLYYYRAGKSSQEEIKKKKTDRKYTYDGKVYVRNMYTVKNTTVLTTTKNNIFYIIQRKIEVVTSARYVTVNLV